MQSQNADNKRHLERARSFLRGVIVHSNGASNTECTIRDISEAGARIQVPRSVTLPEYFDLSIPQKGRHERAKIIWIKDGEIGVIFSEETANSSIGSHIRSEMEHRIHMLEGELYRMRMELNEIYTRLPPMKANSSAA
jgi:hypothetical protein